MLRARILDRNFTLNSGTWTGDNPELAKLFTDVTREFLENNVLGHVPNIEVASFEAVQRLFGGVLIKHDEVDFEKGRVY